MKQTKNMIQQVKRLILIAAFALFTVVAFAQVPPPPPGGSSGGQGGEQDEKLGGSAVGYGGKRLYDLKKEKKEEVV